METNPVLAAFDSAFGQLEGIDVAGLTNDDLLQALQGAARLANRVEALQVSLAGEADDRSTHCTAEDSLARSSGCRNITELLQRSTLISARAARSRLRLARLTRQQITLTGATLPPRCGLVAQGLGSGAMAAEGAALIADMLERIHGASLDDREEAERCLVEAATGIDLEGQRTNALPVHVDNLRIICRAWEQALDPDGAEPDDRAMLMHRSLRLGAERHGLVSITGQLLPEVAATLARIFDAVGSPRAGSAETLGEDAPENAADTRTPGQKRHDIFAMALNIAAQSKDMPSLGGAPVTVVVQVAAEDFECGQGAGWLHGHDGSVTPVSQTTVHRSACSGAVQYLEQDRNGRISSRGSPSRVFTANQRRAIMVRDGGCVIPGCTVPSTWCEIHHVEPHARGGPTHTDNGVMLCFFHHRTIDSGGWQVRMREGIPEIKAPPWLDRAGTWKKAGEGRYFLTV